MLGAGAEVIMMMKQGIAGIAVVALIVGIEGGFVESCLHHALQTGAGAHIVDRWVRGVALRKVMSSRCNS